MATNNGHNGSSGGLFFYKSPGVVEDFAYRALHTGTVLGKQITSFFYQRPYTKSYYLGCSTGGRQGFKEVQDWPEDFDGLVAGAPAFDFNHLQDWSARFYVLVNATTVPLSLWTTVHAEVLKQCDGLDGAVDGVIEDPELCYFRPESLICSAGQTSACLTGQQAAIVRSIYEPLYGLSGNLLYPRMVPGTELQASGIFYAGNAFPYSNVG